MKTPQKGSLIRIYIDESDRHQGKALYESIVLKARKEGVAGATVFKGVMGYGAHSRIHTTKLLRLSQDLPLVIEIVDEKEKIDAFLEIIGDMVTEGLVIRQEVEIVKYTHRDSD